MCILTACSDFGKRGGTPYSFFVAGHTYGDPKLGDDTIGRGIYPAFKAQFESLNEDDSIAFGVFTGDMVQQANVQNWEAVERDLELLRMPVYKVPGNHDYYGDEHFQKRYDSSYYAFTYAEDLFIVLDPMLAGWSIRGEQYEWLLQVLKDHPEPRYTFVFFHHALWAEADGYFAGHTFNSMKHREWPTNFNDSIRPLFEQLYRPVIITCGDMGAISGSSGYMRADVTESLCLVGSGMGGGTDDNYMLFHIDADGWLRMRKVEF